MLLAPVTNSLPAQDQAGEPRERATQALRGNSQPVDDTLLQYLSPLGWEHINLTGDYHWRNEFATPAWPTSII